MPRRDRTVAWPLIRVELNAAGTLEVLLDLGQVPIKFY